VGPTKQPISTGLKSAITKWVENGSEYNYNWKGLFPSDLQWILQQLGVSSKTAQKWITNMRNLLLDGATTIWHLRCREANDGEIPDTEFTTIL
jgi:hypothetical protein